MRAAIDAMREAFAQLAAGHADLPLRTAVRVPQRDGVMLVMPARCDAPAALGGKLVSLFPGNAPRGLPLIHAIVILLDPETGAPRAVVEGATLTALRTGAASGLATELLARPGARRLAVIGSGVQARTQLEAVCCVRPIAEVVVFSRTPEHARRFAEEVAAREGAPERIAVAASASEAAAAADVVCVATTSATPVLGAPDVGSGCHVNAVGSFTAELVELDPALVARARVVVDQRQAALAEAGEVIAAVRAGLIAERDLIELGQVVNGAAPGRRSPQEITLFKSVGLAIQDLCAAERAVRRAEREGLGTIVAF
jgi:ornithine cyclodeaminase